MRQIPGFHGKLAIDSHDGYAIVDGMLLYEPDRTRCRGHGIDDVSVRLQGPDRISSYSYFVAIVPFQNPIML